MVPVESNSDKFAFKEIEDATDGWQCHQKTVARYSLEFLQNAKLVNGSWFR